MSKLMLVFSVLLLNNALGDESSPPTPSAATTLGNLYRQARSEAYYANRYGSDGLSVTSGTIGIRGEPEHRDAAYYESRCITCDPNKSTESDRGWKQRNQQYDPYEDDYPEQRRYRDRYDDYHEHSRGSYDYDRSRGPAYDYERTAALPYVHDRFRPVTREYNRYDPYVRMDLARPMAYSDRYNGQHAPDRYYDNMDYDRNYDRFIDRGNGYDNLDQRYINDGNRYDPYSPVRRPVDNPYMTQYERYNRQHSVRYEPYESYDPYYERNYYRRPYNEHYDRYDRYSTRDRPDSRGYFSSSMSGPSYERGYASSWSYGGVRNNWRHSGRDGQPGPYRPRDYYYDSTASPGGSRGTGYLYDRPESSTKSDSTERDKPTSAPQTQDNKVYKD